MEEILSEHEADRTEGQGVGADLLRRDLILQEEATRLRDRCTEIVRTMARASTVNGSEREYRRAALNLLEDAEAPRRAREREAAERQRAEQARVRLAKAMPFA